MRRVDDRRLNDLPPWSWLPTIHDPLVVRLVYWSDVAALPMLVGFWWWVYRDFTPGKMYLGSRIAYAVARRGLPIALVFLLATMLILALSARARRIKAFYLLLVAAFSVLILWSPLYIG